MAQDRDQLGNLTFESSPGGLFDQGDDAAARNAQEAGGESQDYALDSKGWAIGTGTGSTKGYTPTNNSKYYAGLADSDATRAATAADLAEGYRNQAQAAAMEADSDVRAINGVVQRIEVLKAAVDSDVSHFDTEYARFLTLADKIDSDASAADTDARSADSDARAAAMSETNAAESARQAMGWAIDTENGTDPWSLNARGSSLRWAKASAASALESREARQDIILIRNQIDSDSEAIAGAISAATAYLNALETRVRMDSEEAAESARQAQIYEQDAQAEYLRARAEAVRSRSWAVGPSGDTDASGTDTDNAKYWAERAAAASLDTDVSDSEITLTAGLGLNGGGNFTLNQHADETLTFNLDSDNVTNLTRAGNNITVTYANGNTLEFPIGGGGAGPQDTDLTLTLNPSEIELNISGTQVVQANLSAPGFTISNQTFHVSDPDNNSVPITGTGNSRNLTVSRTTRRTITVSATATLTRTSDSMVFNNVSAPDAHIQVNLGWYRALINTPPTGINAMTDQGIWSRGEHNTQTITADGGDDRLFYALPNRTGGYRFHSGFVVYDTTNHGMINNGSGGPNSWTLYSVDDFDDSQNGATFTVTIEEA